MIIRPMIVLATVCWIAMSPVNSDCLVLRYGSPWDGWWIEYRSIPGAPYPCDLDGVTRPWVGLATQGEG